MSKIQKPNLRATVAVKAHSDPDFLKALKSDAQAAITERLGALDFSVVVHFEVKDEISFIISEQTDAQTLSFQNIAADLAAGGRGPAFGEFEALLSLRAWKDPDFRSLLGSDPLTAVNDELGAFDASVPAGKTVRVYVEGPNECAIVVPFQDDSELSDDELEMVAGGESVVVLTSIGIAAGITYKVIDRIWPVSSADPDAGGGGSEH
jgi:hypothetical protein